MTTNPPLNIELNKPHQPYEVPENTNSLVLDLQQKPTSNYQAHDSDRQGMQETLSSQQIKDQHKAHENQFVDLPERVSHPELEGVKILPNRMETHRASSDSLQQTSIAEDLTKEDDFPAEITAAITKARKKGKRNLTRSRVFLTANFFANILGFLIITETISYLALLIILLAVTVLLSVALVVRKGDYKVRKDKIFDALHLASFAAYLLISIFWLESLIGFNVIGAAPGCTLIILEIFTKRDKYLNQKVVKAAFWGQVVLFAIKLDRVPLPWPLALFVLNFLSILIIISSLMMCILWFTNFCNLNLKGVTILRKTWYIILLLSLVPWSVEIVFFEHLFPIPSSLVGKFWTFFVADAIFCAFGLFLSIILRKKLYQGLKEETFDDIMRHKKLAQLMNKGILRSVKPVESYLVKVSSTYFCADKEGMAKGNKEWVKNHKKHIKQARKSGLGSKPGYTVIEAKSGEALKAALESRPVSLELVDRSMYEIRTTKDEENQMGSEEKVELSFDDAGIFREIKRLDQEDGEQVDKKDCVLCYEREADIVTMGCGHGGMCWACAVKGWKKNDKCYLCRGNIEHLLRVRNVDGIGVYKVVDKIVKVMEKRKIEL